MFCCNPVSWELSLKCEDASSFQGRDQMSNKNHVSNEADEKTIQYSSWNHFHCLVSKLILIHLAFTQLFGETALFDKAQKLFFAE